MHHRFHRPRWTGLETLKPELPHLVVLGDRDLVSDLQTLVRILCTGGDDESLYCPVVNTRPEFFDVTGVMGEHLLNYLHGKINCIRQDHAFDFMDFNTRRRLRSVLDRIATRVNNDLASHEEYQCAGEIGFTYQLDAIVIEAF